jgi:hypothetical protein
MEELAMMRSPWLALGLVTICFASITAIHLFIGRRRFYRTNVAGIQEFKNYRSAILNQFVEGVLGLISMILFVVGFGAVLVVLQTPYKYW